MHRLAGERGALAVSLFSLPAVTWRVPFLIPLYQEGWRTATGCVVGSNPRTLDLQTATTKVGVTMLFRAVVVCAVIAMAETIHGILRVRLLNRRVGDHRARQIGVGTASLIILFITWLTVPWMAPATARDALVIGSLWLTAMLIFEVSLGRFVFHVSWNRIGADFDLRRGGLLGFGMLVLFFAPLLLGKYHHLF